MALAKLLSIILPNHTIRLRNATPMQTGHSMSWPDATGGSVPFEDATWR
jgi:hypothetical protein